MTELPTGTVAFLFTDIEGSTPLAQQFPAELPTLFVRHHAMLAETEFNAHWAEGKSMTMEQAIQLALSH